MSKCFVFFIHVYEHGFIFLYIYFHFYLLLVHTVWYGMYVSHRVASSVKVRRVICGTLCWDTAAAAMLPRVGTKSSGCTNDRDPLVEKKKKGGGLPCSLTRWWRKNVQSTQGRCAPTRPVTRHGTAQRGTSLQPRAAVNPPGSTIGLKYDTWYYCTKYHITGVPGILFCMIWFDIRYQVHNSSSTINTWCSYCTWHPVNYITYCCCSYTGIASSLLPQEIRRYIFFCIICIRTYLPVSYLCTWVYPLPRTEPVWIIFDTSLIVNIRDAYIVFKKKTTYLIFMVRTV